MMAACSILPLPFVFTLGVTPSPCYLDNSGTQSFVYSTYRDICTQCTYIQPTSYIPTTALDQGANFLNFDIICLSPVGRPKLNV